jgi:hypothetical protein
MASAPDGRILSTLGWPAGFRSRPVGGLPTAEYDRSARNDAVRPIASSIRRRSAGDPMADRLRRRRAPLRSAGSAFPDVRPHPASLRRGSPTAMGPRPRASIGIGGAAPVERPASVEEHSSSSRPKTGWMVRLPTLAPLRGAASSAPPRAALPALARAVLARTASAGRRSRARAGGYWGPAARGLAAISRPRHARRSG